MGMHVFPGRLVTPTTTHEKVHARVVNEDGVAVLAVYDRTERQVIARMRHVSRERQTITPSTTAREAWRFIGTDLMSGQFVAWDVELMGTCGCGSSSPVSDTPAERADDLIAAATAAAFTVLSDDEARATLDDVAATADDVLRDIDAVTS